MRNQSNLGKSSLSEEFVLDLDVIELLLLDSQCLAKEVEVVDRSLSELRQQ